MKTNRATGADFKTKHLVLPTGNCPAARSSSPAAPPARQPWGQIPTLAPGREGGVQVPSVPHNYFTENTKHYIKRNIDVEWKVVEHKLLIEGSPVTPLYFFRKDKDNYRRQSSSPLPIKVQNSFKCLSKEMGLNGTPLTALGWDCGLGSSWRGFSFSDASQKGYFPLIGNMGIKKNWCRSGHFYTCCGSFLFLNTLCLPKINK